MDTIKKLAIVVITLGALLAGACSSAEPEDRVFDLEIEALTMSTDKIKVNQDDTVTFNIKSDVLGDLHLHGYNHHAELEPGATSKMNFVADATGNFVIMLHLFEDPRVGEREPDEGMDMQEGEHDEGTDVQEGEHEDEHTEEATEVQLATLEVHPR